MQGAAIDMTELAIRHLAKEAERSQLSPNEFSLRLKHEFRGISTVWESPSVVLTNAARMYIVQMDMIADRFFRSLRDEIRIFKQPVSWVSHEGREKLDTLRQIMANAPVAHARKVENSLDFALVNYYRLVRNDIIHNSVDSGRSAGEFLTLLSSSSEALKRRYPGFDAPNSVDRLGFDDFRVYARALNRLVPPLNDAMALTADDIARVLLADPKMRNTVRRSRGDKMRLQKRVYGYCWERHEMDAAQAGGVLIRIEEFLEKDPTKKELTRNKSSR
jgi:hypothetical protein